MKMYEEDQQSVIENRMKIDSFLVMISSSFSGVGVSEIDYRRWSASPTLMYIKASIYLRQLVLQISWRHYSL